MKPLYAITCFLTLFCAVCTAQTTQEQKPEKKVLAQFGITLINGLTTNSTLTSFGNIGDVKYTIPSQLGVTFSAEIPIYKNIHFFTSPTFLKYSYEFHGPYNGATQNIKQYHFPIQFSYNFELRKSTIFVSPKIGITITNHTENIDLPKNPFRYQGHFNADTILDTYYEKISVESPFVKKTILSLSGGLAFKFVKPNRGEFEIGLSVIYKITPPETNYTIITIEYDGVDNSVIAYYSNQVSFTIKNTILQFYITLYPKLLRITKKIK